MAAEKTQDANKGLIYKGKPLLRRGELLYYGNTDAPYIVSLTVVSTTELIDLELATNVVVKLQTNEIPGREQVIKQAERDGLFSALDLGDYWLTEILAEKEEETQ